jgi:methylated-DNA-protein-cysteine methyltransferase-like protein
MNINSSFNEKVYNAVKLIPKGKVTSYGAIAIYIGSPKASRAVGNALHNNPYDGIVPCHRVVNRKGYLAVSFGFGGREEQIKRLSAENVEIIDNERVNLEKHFWMFQ